MFPDTNIVSPIHHHHQAATAAAGVVIAHAIEAGRLLIEILNVPFPSFRTWAPAEPYCCRFMADIVLGRREVPHASA